MFVLFLLFDLADAEFRLFSFSLFAFFVFAVDDEVEADLAERDRELFVGRRLLF